MKLHCAFLVFIMLFHSSFEAFSQQEKAPNAAIADLDVKLKKDRNNKPNLKKISELLINKGDYDRTIYFAYILDSIASETKDDTAAMYASIYLGQALMMTGNEEKAKSYLDRSLKEAIRLSNDSALSSVYNGLGLYVANIEMDYYKSITYFFKGIEAAKKSSHERLYSILLCNISGIYYLKKDTAGLKYALECYNLGHKKEDAYLIFCGSTNSAYMYFLLKDYEESLKYIKEAEFVMEKNNFYDKTNVYNLFGNILLQSGDNKAAIDMFNKALDNKEQSQTSSVVNTYLSFAKAHIQNRQYKESIRLLKQGLDISLQSKNTIHTFELYEYLSKVNELQGNHENALKYYKTYHRLSDSIFNLDKERTLSELRIRYDAEKHENEVKQTKLELLQKEKKMQLLFFALILIVLILGGTYISYYKKNKLYLQIVKRNQEIIKRERTQEKQISELKNQLAEELVTEKYSVSSMTEEKELKLYEELVNLLQSKYIYKQKDLTKDKLAKLLNTNRTYLSQVINKYSNLSFTHFINSFRIEEAIKILSDPDNNIPLKALSSELGFNSATTFYTAFQSSVGMTPSLYREKVDQIKKQENRK